MSDYSQQSNANANAPFSKEQKKETPQARNYAQLTWSKSMNKVTAMINQ